MINDLLLCAKIASGGGGGGGDPDYGGNLAMEVNTALSAGTTISVNLSGTVNCTIYWGDGTSDAYTTVGAKSHTYASDGVYVIEISGTLTGFGNGTAFTGKEKFTKFLTAGSVGLTNLNQPFRDAVNLVQVPSFLPLSIISMSNSFRGCTSLNDSRISSWYLPNVLTLSSVFNGCSTFNQPVNGWGISASCTSLASAFAGCTVFNQDLDDWDVSGCNNFSSTFQSCPAFNGDVSGWDVSASTNMSGTFYGCTNFAGNLSTWSFPLATTTASMFRDCANFNSALATQTLSVCTSMTYMFKGCTIFNQSLANWSFPVCTTIASMFESCTAFNGSLANWDTFAVSSISSCFFECLAFNQDLSDWNVILIPVAPSSSTFQNTLLTAPMKPVWGTAPGYQIASNVTLVDKNVSRSNSTGSTSSANVGDIWVVYNFREGSTTAPSTPSGFTSIASAANATDSYRISYKKVTVAGSQAAVTSTNATISCYVLLRGYDATLFAGLFLSSLMASAFSTTTSVSLPANTSLDGLGASFYFIGAATNYITLNTAPGSSGLTVESYNDNVNGATALYSKLTPFGVGVDGAFTKTVENAGSVHVLHMKMPSLMELIP